MNKAELMDAMKRQQQYTLMEVRLSAEDIKEHVDEKIDKIEVRVSKLEHFRTYVKGVTKAISIGIPAVGTLGTFLYKFFHLGEKLK